MSWFDPGIHPQQWFDPEIISEEWFDKELLQTEPAVVADVPRIHMAPPNQAS